MILETILGVCIGAGFYSYEEFRKTKTVKEDIMTDTATQQEAKGIKLSEQTMVIGDITIGGIQMLTDKCLAVLTKVIMDMVDEEHSVLSIRFVESIPADVEGGQQPFGKFIPEAKAIIINMNRLFAAMTDRAISGDLCMSMYGYIWLNFWYGIYHEFRHAHQVSDSGGTIEDTEALHQAAEEFSQEMTIQMAKTIDMEMPNWETDPFFGPLLTGFLADIRDMGEDVEAMPGLGRILEMEQSGLVYLERDEGKPDVICKSFKEYCHRLSGDPMDDPSWNTQTATPTTAIQQAVASTLPVVTTQPVAQTQAPVQTQAVHAAHTQPDALDGTTVDAPPMTEDDEGSFNSPYDIDDSIPAGPAATVTQATPTATVEAPFPAGDTPQQVVQQPQAVPQPVAQQPQVVQQPQTVQQPQVIPQSQTTPLPVVGGGAPQQVPNQLVNHNLSAAEIEQCIYEVIMACYTNIFTKCGFMPGQGLGFTAVGNVMTPVSIAHIPNADKVLVAIDTADVQGNLLKHSDVWVASDSRPAGTVQGLVVKEGHLPIYRFYFNINGMEVQRSLMPQNPNKVYEVGHAKQGQFKAWALLAQQGNALAMLSDGSKPKIKILTPPGSAIGHPSVGGATVYEYLNF